MNRGLKTKAGKEGCDSNGVLILTAELTEYPQRKQSAADQLLGSLRPLCILRGLCG
jgi:hypothetical protein